MIAPHDLGTLCIQAQRYAMGRRSTAPLATSEIIRHAWPELEANDRAILVRDLDEQLRDEERCPGALGGACDVRTWREQREWYRVH